MATNSQMRKLALSKANQVRKRLGFEPVDHLYRGQRQDSDNCPITMTIYDDDIRRSDYAVSTGLLHISVENLTTGDELSVKQSKGSSKFVACFDNGDMPDLESNP